MSLINLIVKFKQKDHPKRLYEDQMACNDGQVVRADTFMVKKLGTFKKKEYYLKLLHKCEDGGYSRLQLFRSKEMSVNGNPKLEFLANEKITVKEHATPMFSIMLESENAGIIIETHLKEVQKIWIENLRLELVSPSKVQRNSSSFGDTQQPNFENDIVTKVFKVMPKGFAAKLFRTDSPMTFEFTDSNILLKSSQGGLIYKWDIHIVKKFLFKKENLQIVTGKDESTNTTTSFEFTLLGENSPRKMRKLLAYIMVPDEGKPRDIHQTKPVSIASPYSNREATYEEESANLQHIIPSSDLYEEPPIRNWNSQQGAVHVQQQQPIIDSEDLYEEPPNLAWNSQNATDVLSAWNKKDLKAMPRLPPPLPSSLFNRKAKESIAHISGPINGDLYATALDK